MFMTYFSGIVCNYLVAKLHGILCPECLSKTVDMPRIQNQLNGAYGRVYASVNLVIAGLDKDISPVAPFTNMV